ncbi:hypothetical protein DL96DRAFT_1588399 [Flagelloscypha sp. PMI_526]|nr:hypothetical protein DL96DRAFT_1588399 [Flagelloscypha sp. PMI_526]
MIMGTDQSAYISIIYFFGLSIIAHFISRRSITEASAWKGLKRNLTTWPRFCVLLIFIDSWAFLFSSGFLTLAIGLEENVRSKFFIYAFLIEKVHIVWSNPGTPRFQSRTFILCFIALVAYVLIMILNLFGRIHFIHDDICVIGLQHWSALPLLSYDLLINFVLTGLFLWPLKFYAASLFALTSSTANIAVLSALEGKEPGWVCLACCSADVLVNAFAIYWATGLNSEGQRYTFTTFPEDSPAAGSPSLTTSPSFTVTTSHSRHIISPISPTSGRSAIGKVVYPRTMSPFGAGDNAPFGIVTTVHSHSFQSGPMIFSNGMCISHDGVSDYVPQEVEEEDCDSSHAASLTCEDEIIGAAFSDDSDPQQVDPTISFPRVAVART